MASKIVGRRACPWCGFEHAHVKESDKCLYFYCPGCGTNGPHARTEAQRANMARGMRPEGSQHAPTPTPAPPAAKAAPAPAVPTPTPPRPTPAPAAAKAPAEATPTPTPAPAPAAPRRVGFFQF